MHVPHKFNKIFFNVDDDMYVENSEQKIHVQSTLQLFSLVNASTNTSRSSLSNKSLGLE